MNIAKSEVSRTRSGTVLLICDQFPSRNFSGPTRYNHDIARMLGHLGYEVHLVVTGRSSDSAEKEKDRWNYASIVTLQARTIWRLTVPWSLGAAMRKLRNLLRASGLLKNRPAKRIEFGRPLSIRQQTAAVRQAQKVSATVVFQDTIFRQIDPILLPKTMRSVLISHDVFLARRNSFEALGYEVDRIHDVDETAALHTFDAILAISDTDADYFTKTASGTPCATIYPVAIAVAEVSRSTPLGGSAGRNVFYLGSAAPHNIDGLGWFVDRVWPAIRAAYSDATLHVAGNITDVISPASDGIILHGWTANLSEIASLCVCAINPLRMGSGLKIKVIDYMTLALPTVMTPTSAEGFPISPPGFFLIAEREEDFAEAVIRLLGSKETCATLLSRIPNYIAQFSIEEGATRLDFLLKSMRSFTPTKFSEP